MTSSGSGKNMTGTKEAHTLSSGNINNNTNKKKAKNPLLHLIAGGTAGLVESSICHPLDTIKTRMQLRRTNTAVKHAIARSSMVEPIHRSTSSLVDPTSIKNVMRRSTSTYDPTTLAIKKGLSSLSEPSTAFRSHNPTGTITAPLGPAGTAVRIIQREGFVSLYKGLTAVYTGIIPKMAIRFLAFESFCDYFHSPAGKWYPGPVVFTAGLLSGLTEAILVVTPAEVCKIRMQSQFHSMVDPTQLAKRRKYRNVLQTAMTIAREEGPSALYKGVLPTMIRQGINQSVNFTAYQKGKKIWEEQNGGPLATWQTLILGGVSGGFGPTTNNPLDVVKTRMQKQVIVRGQTPKYTGILQSVIMIAKEEGWMALWKGITPRLLRIMPGQAITFATYEAVSSSLRQAGFFRQ